MTVSRQSPAIARLRCTIEPCELGWVAVAATERGLCAIAFDDSPEALADRLRADLPGEPAAPAPGDGEFQTWLAALRRAIAAPWEPLRLPLDLRGTPFQRQVWQALQAIPPGQTATYGAIAAQIGNPKATRAVARACACNPVALAVPCHRVVGSDGSLRGYRWGRDRKRALLDREAAAVRRSG